MKRIFTLILLFFVVQCVFSQTQNYFVKFKNTVTIDEIRVILKQNNIDSVNFYCPFHTSSAKLQRTFIAKNISLNELKNIKNNVIDYIEKEPTYNFFYTPNDLNSNQWHLNQISADLAWNETTGNNVLIAIVDDAIEISHSDLNANIYVNPNEIPGNGIDDDGNGYIDDINGWDAADNDNNPSPPSNATPSYFSHGTHVAGISAAVTDNSNGVSSIGFNSTILPVKIGLDANSSLTGAYAGLDYAIAAGAQIISMSWGGGSYSITYQNIFNYANSLGIVCIAAAGNSNSSAPMYPASYNNVISVGATNQSDQKASFSNYGSTIDVMAPGVSVYSTVVQNGYGFKSGTSMACPLVSGLAALMIAVDPSLSPSDLENCLKSTCDNINAQNPNYIGAIGSGRINAYESLRCLKPITANFMSDFTFSCINSLVQYSDLSNNSPSSWLWSFPGGTPSTSTLQNPVVTYNSSGAYSVELISTNANGVDTVTVSNYIQIGIPTAQISGTTTLLSGSSALLSVNFTGSAPWSFTYTDGTNNYTLSNIYSSPYQFTVSPTVNTTYTLVNMSDVNCAGTNTGNAIITIVNSTGTSCNSGSTSTFQKTFSLGTNDIAKSIVTTQDGGAVILAKTYSYSQGNSDYLVIKLDANYEIEWQKTFGTSQEESGYKSKMIQDLDGNYVIASHGKSGGTLYPQITKLDPNGNIIWAKKFNVASGHVYYRDIIQTSDGSYICSGTTNMVISSADMFFTKYDVNGNLLWSYVIGRGANDHSSKTIELSNGNFVTTGAVQTTVADREATITMLDPGFNVIWSKSYSFSGLSDHFYHVAQKSNGNIIAVGHSTGLGSPRDIIAIETDLNGNIIWSKGYGNSWEDRGAGIVNQADGTTIITGFSRNSTGNKDLILFNIDGAGNIIWSKKYNNSSTYVPVNEQETIDTTLNGGILFCGNTVETGSDNDILLIKTDKCGNSNCNESNLTINTISTSVTPANITFSKVNYGSLNTLSLSSQNTILDTTNYCSSSTAPPICNIIAGFDFQLNCAGQITSFNDMSIDSTGNIVYWEWSFGDGNSIIGVQNPSHIYTSTGTYTVQLIVGSESISCFDTTTLTITIPNSLTILLNDTIICMNDSIQLNPTILCGIAPYTISWSPITGLSNPNILNPIASPSSTIVYTVTIIDFNGNSSSTSETVIVNSACCVSYPAFNVPSSICLGENFIPFNSSVTTGASTYSWFFPNATPSTYIGQFPPNITYSSAGTYPITLILLDDCGSDTIIEYLGVNPIPTVNIINDTLLCQPDTLFIGVPSIGNLLYAWTPSLQVSDSLSSNPFITDSLNATYYLTVTDPFTGCSNIDSVSVNLFNVSLNIGNDSINCNNDSIVIGSNVAQLNYLWSTGDTTDTITVPSSGTYWLTATQQSCSTTDTVNISIHQINLELGNDTILCNIDSLLINPNIANTNSAIFTWQDNSTDSIYLAMVNGQYYVTVQQNNCTATDTINLVFNQVSLSLGNDTTLCDTDSLILTPYPNNSSFVWGDGTMDTISTVFQSGTYWVTTSVQNCTITDSISVVFDSLPYFSQIDTIICLDEIIQVDVSIEGGATYLWQPNGDTTPTLSVGSGEYELTIQNFCGSITTAINIASENCNCDFSIPNVFTPNYDGENEYFSLINMSEFCELQSLEVYNRWGEKLFFSNDIYYSWDGRTPTGKEASEGTYYYIIKVNDMYYKGNFSLFR